MCSKAERSCLIAALILIHHQPYQHVQAPLRANAVCGSACGAIERIRRMCVCVHSWVGVHIVSSVLESYRTI